MQITQVNIRDELIDFANGQPGVSILPTELIEQAAADCFSRHDPEMLKYGPEQGDAHFLESLSKFLTPRYGFPVHRDELLVTTSNSTSIDLVCAMFTKPGDTVFIEEPTYFLAPKILQVDYALNVIPIPVDEDGMSLDALEVALAKHQPKFVYTIPTYHNPTGHSMSQERRERLHQLAQENNFLIIADEVYQLLSYHENRPPPLAMAQFTSGNKVISLGSFSKILAPGLRLGWVQTGPELMERFITFGKIVSSGSLNHMVSGIVRSAIDLGLQAEYLEKIKGIYKHRIDLMDEALHRYLPNSISWKKPEGGFFFWLTLPDGVSATDLAKRADPHNIGFVPGPICSNVKGLDNKIRLSFAFYDDEEIIEGCRRLGELFKT
ncbi:MAG: 2-aminoadipate transaminase [Cellvibrionaceae bacterium]|jgi:2-aminoadipate transaminase